jgi:hypothetical protein
MGLLAMSKLILELQRLTKMAALNGGLIGVVARWAVIEMDPALWPQLRCMYNTNEQLMSGGPHTKSLQSNLVRITAELGNVGLDPGKKKLFWQIPEPSALRLK